MNWYKVAKNTLTSVVGACVLLIFIYGSTQSVLMMMCLTVSVIAAVFWVIERAFNWLNSKIKQKEREKTNN